MTPSHLVRRVQTALGLAIVLLIIQNAAAQAPQGPAPAMPTDVALTRALGLIEALEKEEMPDPEKTAERYREATQLVTGVLRQEPLNATAGYAQARLAILSGRPRAALAPLEAYIADPVGRSDWYAHKLLGDLYLASYAKRARAQYEFALQLAPNEPEALIGFANANLQLNRAPDAIEYARKAIQLDKQFKPNYRAILARGLLLVKQYDQASDAAWDAVKYSEVRIRSKPGDNSLLSDARQNYALLIECLTNLVSLYPEQSTFLVKLAQAYQDRADLERLMSYHGALALIEEALRHPEVKVTPDLIYEQARLNRVVGRNEQALELVQRVLEMSPDNVAAQKLHASLTQTDAVETNDEAPRGERPAGSGTAMENNDAPPPT